MARLGKLTALKVAALARVKKPGFYGDGGGLYLQISRYGGSASWVFRYRTGGRLRDHGLGSLDTWSLAEARERARKCRQLRGEGRDPIDERRAEREQAKLEAAKAMTFRQCAEAYIAAHQTGWKNPKHAAQWPATLETYVYPICGALPVQSVDVGLVMKAIEPIWTTKPETASRVRGRIESVLDWAAVRKFRKGENPARWKGHLDHLLPAPTRAKRAARKENGRSEHYPSLPYAELPAFVVELRGQEGFTARALEFAILTAARTGEVIGARWQEINFAERTWTVPAERMKSGREHRIPLSDAVMTIVEPLHDVRSGEFVFPGLRAGKPLSDMSLLMLLRRMGRRDLTTHGFRSTFRTWAAERTAFPREIAEMALGHVVGDVVERAYQRGDLFEKRRQLAEAWARYCKTLMLEAEVVPLRQPLAAQ
jgi:integrase